jgi:hypothetical protein
MRDTTIITFVFDKNGEADYRVSLSNLQDLDLEKMRQLRETMMVGIGQVERYWAERPGQEQAQMAVGPELSL